MPKECGAGAECPTSESRRATGRAFWRWAIVIAVAFAPIAAADSATPGNGPTDIPQAKCRFCVCGKARHHPKGDGGFMAAYCPIACVQQIKVAKFCDTSPLIDDDTILAERVQRPAKATSSISVDLGGKPRVGPWAI